MFKVETKCIKVTQGTELVGDFLFFIFSPYVINKNKQMTNPQYSSSTMILV